MERKLKLKLTDIDKDNKPVCIESISTIQVIKGLFAKSNINGLISLLVESNNQINIILKENNIEKIKKRIVDIELSDSDKDGIHILNRSTTIEALSIIDEKSKLNGITKVVSDMNNELNQKMNTNIKLDIK
jgi:hypothetical protein